MVVAFAYNTSRIGQFTCVHDRGKANWYEFEQESEQHDLEDDVGRHLQKIEWRARALVEGAPTTAATKSRIPQVRVGGEFPCLRGPAIGAVHPFDSQ
jgi:hypothetical protein